MAARQSNAGEPESGALQTLPSQSRTNEEEKPSDLPVGWDMAQHALRTKRWDRLVSLYEQPLKEQPGNVFIISLHGSLNPVHWDHIRMFEAGKKIIEKKVGD